MDETATSSHTCSAKPTEKSKENQNVPSSLLSDSEDESESCSSVNNEKRSRALGYHNLETFQKKQLKQKLKMFTPSTTRKKQASSGTDRPESDSDGPQQV